MKIKKFNQQHKPVINSWFKKYEWAPCDWTTVTKNAFVVAEGSELLAFNYFYTTDAKNVGVMGVTIANPNLPKAVRDSALDAITSHLLKKVESNGIEYFFYFTDKNPMVERMQRHGMTLTDNGDAFILMKSFGKKTLKYFNE